MADFRTRNPNLRVWPQLTDDNFSRPCPFDGDESLVFQLDAPDHSTSFLALNSHYTGEDDDDIIMVYYLIEAPPECPMRQEFEQGELTWLQYWYHKEWLVEYKAPLFGGEEPAEVRYVSLSQLPTSFKTTLQHLNDRTPLQLKYNALKKRSDEPPIFGLTKREIEKAKQELASLLKKYPDLADPARNIRSAA